MVDPSGRDDAATVERGGAHRGKDSKPGLACQPTLRDRRASRGCSPRRRQNGLLVNESAPSAAAARGLHKGRHRLMTAERRLLSMHCAVGSPPYGRGSTPMTPWTEGTLPEKGLPEHTVYHYQQHEPILSTKGTADAETVTRGLERADQRWTQRRQATRTEATK
mgnify:CR=1 FL=1